MGNQTARDLVKVTANIEKEFGVKYCTKCNRTRPVEGGKTRALGNKRTRWECVTCAAKTTPAGYKR